MTGRRTDADERGRHSVLVTGGRRGIGLAIAQAFAGQGDKVAVTSRALFTPPTPLFAVRCDITRVEDVERAFDEAERRHGPIEVLVANAGIINDTLLASMTDQQFEDVLATNLTGTFRCARRAVRSMLRTGWGRIILISSAAGLLGNPGQTNYAATKAGLIGLGRSLTRELGARGITVNIVAPGFVETEVTASLPPAVRSRALLSVPLGRSAEPRDIAPLVRFLASDEAAYISGAVIPVDGGLAMGH
ncbi:3-oxoacyl-ACP reductase FabG [Streptomyces pathocidini]|uniref:3-oxoacyl-ACP reductase FabG n=1 Tax=Streptomyces pathocidini TaxID=1650571 RepID=UPI0033F0B386